jgi:hypothetical protein
MPLIHKLSCSHHTLVYKEQDCFSLKVKFVNDRKPYETIRHALNAAGLNDTVNHRT